MILGNYGKYDYREGSYALIFAGEGYWDKRTRIITRNGIFSLDYSVCSVVLSSNRTLLVILIAMKRGMIVGRLTSFVG